MNNKTYFKTIREKSKHISMSEYDAWKIIIVIQGLEEMVRQNRLGCISRRFWGAHWGRIYTGLAGENETSLWARVFRTKVISKVKYHSPSKFIAGNFWR